MLRLALPLLLWLDVLPAVAASFAVTNLRCEYLENPLGLDVERPRFTWQLAPVSSAAPPRAAVQQSYRLRLGERGRPGLVWDSGEVASVTSYNVEYGGPPLASGGEYWWAVSVMLADGATVTSAQATFAMGMLSRDAWTGSFIGMASATEGVAPWFRTSFQAPTDFAGRSALLFVASIGFCEVYVNGKAASDAVLSPSVSHLPNRVLYRTYNVTELLNPGAENAIGLWAAPGWADYFDFASAHFPQRPLVMAELHMNTAAGIQKIITNSAWKCHASNTARLGSYGSHGFGGDSIDDRATVDGWSTAELKDDHWESAREYDLSAKNLAISADVMEPTVRQSQVHAKSVEVNGPKQLIVMDELYTGWFEVANLQGPPNSSVNFYVSTTKGIDEEYGMLDAFTFGSSGRGTFRMRFSYHEIHYITVVGLHDQVRPSDVTGWRLTSDLRRTGHFLSSSPLMTKIYDTTVNNYQGLTTGGMTVDCPHRERRGYGGDGHTSYQFALANFGVGSYFTKWARDFADVQEPSGHVPHTAPTVGGGGGPAWSGFVVTLPYQVYKTYGDTSLLRSMFPTMARLLAFYAMNTKSDGLLHPWTDSQWDFLGDWITPHGSEANVTSPENLLFNNCYLRYITSLTAEIALVLGNHSAAEVYRKKVDALTDAINRAFYNKETGVYIDMLQTHLVMPLAAGVVPDAAQPRTVANLEQSIRVLQNGHLDTGLTGTYFLFKLLTEHGRDDLAFLMANQTTFPGYGYFLEQGFTTWPEDWNLTHDVSKTTGISKMHGCYNAIGLWFVQGIAGITVDASQASVPITIRAGVEAGDLAWAEGSREAPQGRVESSWRVTPQGFFHNITVPPNSAARVLIPGKAVEDVRESGLPLEQVQGVWVLGTTSIHAVNYVKVKVLSGKFAFSSTWTRPGAALISPPVAAIVV